MRLHLGECPIGEGVLVAKAKGSSERGMALQTPQRRLLGISASALGPALSPSGAIQPPACRDSF